jgi:4-hydroxy-3-polyprenylbenzoate decarboxylase
MEMRVDRFIVAITGASGAIYGIKALELLRTVENLETHLVVSAAGLRTIGEETSYSFEAVRALAHVTHNYKDIGASIASGSFKTRGMLIAPCSVRTLSSVAYTLNENLISRAADVCLKERRRVVLLLRETPLHHGHIEAMERATRSGAIIMPPVPGFYHKPKSIDDMLNQTVGRALDLFDIDTRIVKRWTETDETNPSEPRPLGIVR